MYDEPGSTDDRLYAALTNSELDAESNRHICESSLPTPSLDLVCDKIGNIGVFSTPPLDESEFFKGHAVYGWCPKDYLAG